MDLNIYKLIAYPLYLVAILDAFFGILVLKNNPRNNKINKAVAVVGFSASLYSCFAATVYLLASYGTFYITLYRACHIGWLAIPAFFQSAYYLDDENSPRARLAGQILYPLWSIIIILIVGTDWIEKGVYSLVPFVDKSGPLEKAIRILGGICLIWVTVDLIRLYRRSFGFKRMQTSYFILGNLFYTVGGGLGAGFLQVFGNLRIDPALVSYFSFPWMVFSVYAITRYHLFDIKIAISRALFIIVLLLSMTVIHIGFFNILDNFIPPSLAVLISFIVTISIFFATPAAKRLQGIINSFILKDKYYYQSILRESIKAVVSILDSNELLIFLIDVIKKNLRIDKICLFLRDESGNFHATHRDGVQECAYEVNISNPLIEWLQQQQRIFIREEQASFMPQIKFNELYGSLSGVQAELVIPLLFKEKLIGIMTLGPKGNRDPFVESDIEILESLADQSAIAIENARLYTEAITDGLTRLYHQKYFFLRLKEELSRSKRYKHPLSLIMLDVDNFKSFNDKYGHLAGDAILKAVADLIKKNTRESDIVARYGGEEFIILLPETSLSGARIAGNRLMSKLSQAGALEVAEQIRKNVELYKLVFLDKTLQITASLGVTAFDGQEQSMDSNELISKADKALYKAKEHGRNRIEISD